MRAFLNQTAMTWLAGRIQEKFKKHSPIRFQREGGILVITPKVVHFAAQKAVGKLDMIHDCQWTAHDDYYEFFLDMGSSPHVTFKLRPEGLVISGKQITVTLKLHGGRKDGVEIHHTSAPVAFTMRLFDHIFGAVEKKVSQIDGFSLHEDTLTFTRDLGESSLFSAIQDRFPADKAISLPLSVEGGWLRVHFGELFKGDSTNLFVRTVHRWFSSAG